MNKATGKKLKITIDAEKGRPINRVQSVKLSNQLGFISRECILVPTKWRDMEDDDFNLAMDHLEVSENISLYLCRTPKNLKFSKSIKLNNKFLKWLRES